MATKKIRNKMAKLGKKGGLATKKKGAKFFSKISKKRKHFRGGRKPKNKSQSTPVQGNGNFDATVLDS